jgi:hypothetical protein
MGDCFSRQRGVDVNSGAAADESAPTRARSRRLKNSRYSVAKNQTAPADFVNFAAVISIAGRPVPKLIYAPSESRARQVAGSSALNLLQ